MTRHRIGKWTIVVITRRRVIVRKLWMTGDAAEVIAIGLAGDGHNPNWHVCPGHLRVNSWTDRSRKAKAVRS